MNSKQEELSYAIQNLDEEATEIVLQLVYKLINDKDDLIDENGEVVVDEFYKKLLANIDQEDDGQTFTYDEIKKELGIA
ncbi:MULTISPECIES: hypothetical protein [Enterococcus]|uniref:Uncharacterized protein n=1 Tax=Enterococcus raffinosus ATCC 49464 TaxID=1158602 RepID=R2NSZ7_9ENTE|nr:hypothetical protein [Enterococcus raffinosus]EOH74128.1 hypothetical protein UAK_03948 [Enterococcus raffinosus ATCC 49464]EOT82264.1 hypothetical protein I590_00689 [Enterococcus raffinosus ATCC 49464]UXK04488.1 hypothetical protein N7K38_01605 [Enterococcus raffinosus]HDU2614959.1 hypothetical protein [Enterococcus faecalis]